MPKFLQVVCLCALAPCAALAQLSPDAAQFFEMKIRPVLHICQGCHNDQKRTSGLSLESRDGILGGGSRGYVVDVGHPDTSRLVQAVRYTGDLKMPPTGKLRDSQIADLARWIEIGLPWPEGKASAQPKGAKTDHWAFRPPVRPAEPNVRNAAWASNPIDRFILARLEKEGLEPSPEADRITVIRRLSLDLVGLPPSPVEVDEFVADRRPDAYEKLVERLLASPHYGERWGRHWLDAARYADTNGFGFDNPRVMWRWRDWVINAFNRDLPFDRFVIEQLAGDLLPDATTEQRIATGFHRNTMINQEGGVDQEQYRVEAVFDRVATTGAVFLGLTVGCAQCHDHKYDPISQREFYQLFAFFNNQDEPTLRVVPAGEVAGYRQIAADYEVERLRLQGEIARYNAGMVARLTEWEKNLTTEARQKLPGNIQDILRVPPARRELAQVEDLEKHHKEYDTSYHKLQKNLELLVSTPNNRNPNQYTAMVLAERDKPRKSHVLILGDFLKTGVEVAPAVPAVLPALPKSDATPNRLTLARWLVSPDHPLTSRVTVNRIWQMYFGRGLVKTSEDFGTQGDKPSHPELLDWLATEFPRQGWSMKAMHRLIVTSATYRQASRVTPSLRERDPDNVLLARSPRLRVEAEVIRDIALTASGLIHHQVGGPSVFPPQPPGITDLSRGNLIWVNATGPNRYRRGLYTFWKRTSPYPALSIFDVPSFETTSLRRSRTNTPTQALTTLNDEVFVEAAQVLALRLLKEVPGDDDARLRHGFRLCVSREPDGLERDTLVTFLKKELDRYAGDPAAAKALLPPAAPGGIPPARFAAWFGLSRVLLNMDETITRE